MKLLIDNIEKDKVYALAVSGGIDSMVLLDCFIKLKSKENIDFFVVTIDHNIRGETSASDVLFVKGYCDKYNVECVLYSVDAPKLKNEKHLTMEQAARELRYGVFDSLLTLKTADYIVLAHQASDQAETVLMRILRGTGIEGLKGIADRSGYLHPLIKYSREEIETYAKENNIFHIEDETNLDERYTRNFFRLSVLPLLKTRYPQAEKCINRLSLYAKETDDMVKALFVPAKFDKDRAWLNLDVFSMQGTLVRKSIMDAFNFLSVREDIEKRHIDALVELSKKETSTSIDMPYNIKAVKERDKIVFFKNTVKEEYEKAFSINESYSFLNKALVFIKVNAIEKGVFDADKIPPEAKVRTRKEGDFFKRYKGGTKSLGDYFTDINLPLYLRDKTLLLANGSEILLIAGGEVSDKIKVDENSAKIYKAILLEDEDEGIC